jgi:hypothetical protein
MTSGKWPFETEGGLPSLAVSEANSPLWRVVQHEAEACIGLLDNTSDDHERGTTLVFGDPEWTDYSLKLETKVIKGRMPNPLVAWWGFGLRAQDPYNMECFFFQPASCAPDRGVPPGRGCHPPLQQSAAACP